MLPAQSDDGKFHEIRIIHGMNHLHNKWVSEIHRGTTGVSWDWPGQEHNVSFSGILSQFTNYSPSKLGLSVYYKYKFSAHNPLIVQGYQHSKKTDKPFHFQCLKQRWPHPGEVLLAAWQELWQWPLSVSVPHWAGYLCRPPVYHTPANVTGKFKITSRESVWWDYHEFS